MTQLLHNLYVSVYCKHLYGNKNKKMAGNKRERDNETSNCPSGLKKSRRYLMW